jgi:hypothetical protein
MKPKWEDAPYWANYLTMDEDGEWAWHEFTPSWRWGGSWTSDGRSSYAGHNPSWTDSLEKRPEEFIMK